MSLNTILKQAQAGKYAIGQFNASNLETIRAIAQAAQKLNSPVIIGTSEGEGGFIGFRQAVKLIEAWKEETGIPVFLNADHFKSLDIIKKAVKAGYNSIHFDGSKLSFEENIKQTNEVVKYVKSVNSDMSVEGELGYLRGVSSIHKEEVKITKEDFTKPEEAEIFVKETGVDRLAVVIGNVHGISASGINPGLNLEKLKEIQQAVPEIFLVLHGGSGTPQEDLKNSIENGIVKVNINTELRVAYAKSLINSLKENPEEITPYKIFPFVIEAVQGVVEEKIKLFGSH